MDFGVGETSWSRFLERILPYLARSAGACPPRSLGRPEHGEGNPLGCACGIRGPKPYGAEAFFSVVCDRLITNGSGSGDPDLQNQRGDRCMARGTLSHARVACEGPSPTMKGDVIFIVARGPVPRDRSVDRSIARDRPSPYGAGGVFAVVRERLLPIGSGSGDPDLQVARPLALKHQKRSMQQRRMRCW